MLEPHGPGRGEKVSHKRVDDRTQKIAKSGGVKRTDRDETHETWRPELQAGFLDLLTQ